jgi:pimeloyl-CoA synthetase
VVQAVAAEAAVVKDLLLRQVKELLLRQFKQELGQVDFL